MFRKIFILAAAMTLLCGGTVAASVTIPIYGNAYITAGPTARGGVNVGRPAGIANWTDPASVVSIYFHVSDPGSLTLSLHGTAPGDATIEATVNGKAFTVNTADAKGGKLSLGTVEIPEAGHVRVDLKGLERKGETFGEWSALEIDGSAAKGTVTFAPTEPANKRWSYWGRRGPSVHMNYDISGLDDVRWFYNELTVPEGQDPGGIYAMANGFRGGYMGIQVAANGGRRVLFSIWSTYVTDNPREIPDSLRVAVLRKGASANANDFGGEGSGGQSFMAYPWEAGKTYAFLTSAEYDARSNSTIFTGYFRGHDGEWYLITSMRQPTPEARSLVGIHSFLENFHPDNGYLQRTAGFSNQWVRTADGVWHELTNANFSFDDTGRSGIRLDYKGWGDDKGFWLRNGGYFDGNTEYRARMKRTDATHKPPVIDWEALSKL